jgi:hypothetical protein
MNHKATSKDWNDISDRLRDLEGISCEFVVISNSYELVILDVFGNDEDIDKLVSYDKIALRDMVRDVIAGNSKDPYEIRSRKNWPNFNICRSGRCIISVDPYTRVDCVSHCEKITGIDEKITDERDSVNDTSGSSDVYKPSPERLHKRADEIGDLLVKKNETYGNSFHTSPFILSLLYPDGIDPDKYDDLIFLIRIWDKLKRIANNKSAFCEDPYEDIAGYAILASERYRFGVDVDHGSKDKKPEKCK